MSDETRRILYTDAPSNYDGFGTTELDAQAGTDSRGRPIRKVSILDESLTWQTSRYDSGLYVAVGAEDLADWSMWTITESREA